MVIEEIILIAFLIFISIYTQDIELKMMLYLVTGIVTILIVSGWAGDYPGIASVFGGFSVFLIIKSLMIALQQGGTARGWSQFRGVWNQIREMFDK